MKEARGEVGLGWSRLSSQTPEGMSFLIKTFKFNTHYTNKQNGMNEEGRANLYKQRGKCLYRLILQTQTTRDRERCCGTVGDGIDEPHLRVQRKRILKYVNSGHKLERTR